MSNSTGPAEGAGVLLILEIALFITGIVLLRKVSVQIGGMVCRSPRTVFAGIILALQLPMAVGMGFAIGGAEGIKAKREGIDPAEHTARIAKKYRYADIALVGTAAGLAGLIVLTGLRPITYEPPPPDEPIGITDHRAVMRDKWAENDRIARARHRQHADYEDGEPTVDEDSTARLTSRFRD